MKLGGRERMDDGAALEELFAQLPVSADWTIGFLTAICTGPDPIAPTLWIPEIVPQGAFDEDPAARAKVDLLARLYGAVAETLGTSPTIICPEPDKPAQEAIDFCRGYVHGAGMHASWGTDELGSAKLLRARARALRGADPLRARSAHDAHRARAHVHCGAWHTASTLMLSGSSTKAP